MEKLWHLFLEYEDGSIKFYNHEDRDSLENTTLIIHQIIGERFDNPVINYWMEELFTEIT
jgi:hypothetical protein